MKLCGKNTNDNGLAFGLQHIGGPAGPILKIFSAGGTTVYPDPDWCVHMFLALKRINNDAFSVVPLFGMLWFHVKKRLINRGYSWDDVKEKKEKHWKFYKSIDGCHIQFVTIEPLEEDPIGSKDFVWEVFSMNPAKHVGE